jgi:glycosyltransferase involved in cell wall biosynthesis
MKVSIVICLYNEELNVKPLINSIDKSMAGFDFEVILVDDGSRDQTVKEIINNSRPWLKLIRLTKNYGQSSALAAGIDFARGQYIVTMDGDLQNDPVDIPRLVGIIESEDCDMVAGYRENRRDNYLLRKLPSFIANILIRRTTGIKIKDYGCTLKIFRSSVAKDLKLYGELHRFIPVLASLDGNTRILQTNVKHHARKFGRSKYTITRTLRVLSDLLLLLFFKRYMQKPMHLFGAMGVVLTFAGIVINFYLLWLKINGHDIWGKPLILLGMLLFLSGIQLITIGLIAEYVMRIYYESQNKKPYNIRSIRAFDTKSQEIFSDGTKVTH